MKKTTRGFTIVELLVVIVVIGILAAISIVSYTGVTGKANTTKALANANSLQSVADVYYSENGKYPQTSSTVVTGAAVLNPPYINTNANTMTIANWTGIVANSGNGIAPSTVKVPTSITVIPGAARSAAGVESGTTVDANNGLTTIAISCLTSCLNTTGGRIGYWDFNTNSVKYIYFGLASGASSEVYATPATIAS